MRRSPRSIPRLNTPAPSTSPHGTCAPDPPLVRCPSLDLLHHLSVLPELGGWERDTALTVWPDPCRVQGKHHFPGPAAVLFLAERDAFLAAAPPGPFPRAARQPPSLSVYPGRVGVAEVQPLPLALLNLVLLLLAHRSSLSRSRCRPQAGSPTASVLHELGLRPPAPLPHSCCGVAAFLMCPLAQLA